MAVNRTATRAGKQWEVWARWMGRVAFADEEECWLWTGKRSSSGYGQLHLGGGRYIGAHRYAAAGFRIPPVHLKACHACDNPPCVNPGHLWLAPHEDNMLDLRLKGRRKGRGGMPGEQHNMAHLSAHQVMEIRERYRPRSHDANCYTLAREFGVRPQQISRILRGERWAA